MKLKTVTKKRNRGRKAFTDAKLFLFYFPEDDKEKVQRLNDLAKKCKVKRYTYAYCLREGVRLFVKQQRVLLSKALSGKLHAKQRST
jgi:hypothetical protein